MCTHMCAHYVKVLANYIASLPTVVKQSLGMFNSAHCMFMSYQVYLYACEASSRVSKHSCG